MLRSVRGDGSLNVMALAPAVVCERLTAAGLRYQPSELKIELHEERWLVRLPGLFLAWFAASTRGRDALHVAPTSARVAEEPRMDPRTATSCR